MNDHHTHLIMDSGDMRQWTWPVFAVSLVICAILFGVLATTADPLMIGMGLALIGGAFLLATPRLVVWLVLLMSLTGATLIAMVAPELARLSWAISLLSFLLLPMSLLYLVHQKRTHWFLWLTCLFVIVATLASFLHWYSASQFVAGFKRYFQAHGLLLSLAVLTFTAKDFRRWEKLVLGIALLQLPFVLYQFFFLVPLRGGLEKGGETTDVVAGTFGANMEGGSPSSIMAAFLLVVLAFMFARWRANLIATRNFMLLVSICALPLAFGETKIVIFLLPLMGFILLRKDFLKAPLRYLPSLVAIAGLTALLGHVYVAVMMNRTPGQVVSDTFAYNFGSTGYGDSLLNRSTVLSFWSSQHGLDDPLRFLFGHGLGSSFRAPDNPVTGDVAAQYPGYNIDLTAAASLLWDTGVIGLIIYLASLVAAWVAANGVRRSTTSAVVRADALAIQAAIGLFVVFVVYSKDMVNLLAFQVVIAATLGYLGYLVRTVATDSVKPNMQGWPI